jgi:tetratricopeptide (TPR) repeat protein
VSDGAGIRRTALFASEFPPEKTAVSTLREVFELLIDLPPGEQAARLEALALDPADLERLRIMLDVDAQRSSIVDVPVADAIGQLCIDVGLGERMVGAGVGSFRILDLIGEGGSSVVFRAERAAGNGSQLVALKMLRVGLFSARAEERFRREHAILAQLSHPNIARLVEGGVSDAGIPYIAMELIDGEPITHAAARRSLNLEARLRLFAGLCRAVGAAHAALIVHRDLKPSNVLVDAAGELKIVDFGIARLLQTDGDPEPTHTVSLTPEYAAPEQFARGHQTVAVDVYALGILLGELVTGVRVRDRAPSAVAADPDTPIASGLPARELLHRCLRGDIDAIVATATAEEPARRYASVEALATDIERHLAALPINARAPSAGYRARKFLARHRVAIAITALVGIAVLSSLALAWSQARVARQEAARANAVRDFVVDVFDAARAGLARDQRPTPEALVDQAGAKLAAASDLDPATRADLDRTLGEVWLSLQYAQANGTPDMAAELTVLRADGWQRTGRNADAVAAIAPLLDSLRTRPAPPLVRALRVIAAAEMSEGRHDDALAHQREAAAVVRQLHGEGMESLAADLETGGALAVAGRFDAAITVIEPLLTRWRALGAPEDERYVRALTNLMVAADALGRADDAEARVRDIIEVKRRIYPAPHEAIAKSLRDLANLVARRGDHATVATLLSEALAMQREVLGEQHVEVAKTLDSLGVSMASQHRYAEAEGHYRAALAICARARVHDDVCPRARANLGQVHYRQGRLGDAERELSTALAERRRIFGDDHANVAVSASRLSGVVADLGDAERAIELASDAIATFERAGQASSREAALAHQAHAHALDRAGRHAEALTEIDRALADWQRVAPDERDKRGLMQSLRARILGHLSR